MAATQTPPPWRDSQRCGKCSNTFGFFRRYVCAWSYRLHITLPSPRVCAGLCACGAVAAPHACGVLCCSAHVLTASIALSDSCCVRVMHTAETTTVATAVATSVLRAQPNRFPSRRQGVCLFLSVCLILSPARASHSSFFARRGLCGAVRVRQRCARVRRLLRGGVCGGEGRICRRTGLLCARRTVAAGARDSLIR